MCAKDEGQHEHEREIFVDAVDGQEKRGKQVKTFDTIIAGGGPSGMAAALACLKGGQRVLLVDHCDKIGKKILVTGNGKCNLTNRKQTPDCYRGEMPEKAAAVLSAFGLKDAMELFRSIGILTRERDGYVYPYNEQASAVREAFESALMAFEKFFVLSRASVEHVRKTKDGFRVSVAMEESEVRTEEVKKKPAAGKTAKARRQAEKPEKRLSSGQQRNDTFLCRNLIIATGGLAGVKLGCDGSGYQLAERLGHRVIPPLPALTALKSPAPFLKKLSGLRNRAGITLLVDGEKVCREQGELQWTDYGISGVAVFQVSRFAVVALEEGKQVQLSLDFMPEYTVSEVKELLYSYGRACAYKNAEDLLMGILPAKLTPVLLREAFRNDGDLGTLAEVIKDFSLRISGYMGYEKAQVTRGGVDMREVTEELESRICPGLFFAGEVLDVDGTCGGYNLQWAFSSGSVAGRAACRR